MSEFSTKLKVSVVQGEERMQVVVVRGANLRDVLLRHRLTPYRGASRRINCQGLGLCGTCKVRVKEDGEWWERRSCQIRCFHDLEIALQ